MLTYVSLHFMVAELI